MALWAGAFLISMTWLYSVHLHQYPNYWATALLAVAGVVCFALALRKKVDFSSTTRAWALLILPLALGVLILDFPNTFGPVVLILGLCGLLLFRSYAWAAAIAASLLVTGAILTLQSVTFPLYFHYVAKDPHVPFLSQFIYPILRFFGLRTSMSGGVIYIQTMRNLWPFPTSWAGLGLFPLVQFFVASAVVISLFGGKPAKGIRALWAFIIGVVYLILRYAFLLLFFTYLMYFVGYFDNDLWVNVLWHRGVALLSFIPLLLIFAKAFPLQRTGEAIVAGLQLQHFGAAERMRKGIVVLATALGVFFFAAYLGYWDPGWPKLGRVLIDEKYSDWEKSDRTYDTKWYGNESGYNYWSMADLMSYYFSVDKKEEYEGGKGLTENVLKNYDVVLLKNPTYPYSDEEVEALVKFVEDGGGIFLMSEHTSVFGTSVPLNAVGRRFGFFFRYDVVFDMETKFEQLWHVPKLMPSPMMHNQKDFLFAVSCSIEPSGYFGPTRNAAVGPGLWALPIEYHSPNFYPKAEMRTDMTFGPLVQLIAATRGKGRVVGFVDSTTLSNFSSQLPGKPELLLSSINWLNRKNRLSYFNGMFLALSVLFFVGAFAVSLGTPRHHGARLATIAVAVCAAAVSMTLFTGITRKAYPLPEPRRDLPKVVFERQYSEYIMPTEGFVKDQDNSYSIFFQWVLRLQYFPFLKDSIDEALAEKPDILVMINPSDITPPGRDFVDHPDTENVQKVLIPQLKAYLEAGGKLLLMDDIENEKSMSNMILEEFGMRLDAGRLRLGEKPGQTTLLNAEGKPVCLAPSGYFIIGGRPLLTRTDGKVVLARKSIGKGTLVVMSASKRFCDGPYPMPNRPYYKGMGVKQDNKPVIKLGAGAERPNTELFKAFYLEFALIRGMMNDNLDEELNQLDDELIKLGLR